MSPGTGQKLLNLTKETIRAWSLFDHSDKLLIGVSGGKDSLTLLDCLFRLGFGNLHAIHIRIDPSSPLEFTDFCHARSDFTIIETDILKQVNCNSRRNKCYMCAKARRKALSEYAVTHGFSKLVLAHHRDDAIETLLLNLLFQREISTMLPRQKLFNGRLEIVRPFYTSAEQDIIRYAKQEGLPITDWNCGLETDSKRVWIRRQIRLWQKDNPRLKIADNIYEAMLNVNPDFLPQTCSAKKV